MKRSALLVSLLLIGQPALAYGDGASPAVAPLSNLLPPPPAAGSTAAQHDLQAVLTAQRSRTAQDMAAAKADSERSVFRFADALGLTVQAAALPKTAAFFDRVAKLDKAEAKEAKEFWKHPRPSVVSSQVHALSKEKPDDWSYPSGHATFGYSTAVLLANMLPEKREAIFARAELYGEHRIVMGVHFPSDVEAGKIAGTVIADEILRDPQWQADYDAARGELRHALGLQ
ncbi:acid phosphatase [Dyella nitratireducens]|uniref:undecaprenyl-diphosphate phosphatase n=1 Tax=Dyella nitratireducens TaxID=1849580 RepID=A0ABQ1FKR8_9GAMM|nr:phosphatase PAP2 family protein [Dyella nitratireducens]GGA17152.1 acid phosphatase [Dyella nitratireducens]GLQ44829.1 acid phosphatase [Dyella nitratireducens]